MKLACAVFDMDGTIVDNMAYHVRAWLETSRGLGHHGRDSDHVHAGRTRGADSVERVLEGDALLRGNTERPGGGDVDVGRGLPARRVLRADHRVEANPETSEHEVPVPRRSRRREGAPLPGALQPAKEVEEPGHGSEVRTVGLAIGLLLLERDPVELLARHGAPEEPRDDLVVLHARGVALEDLGAHGETEPARGLEPGTDVVSHVVDDRAVHVEDGTGELHLVTWRVIRSGEG